MKASLRASFAALASSVALLVASTALADGEACFNDDDCPGTACGDAVCNWSKMTATPMEEKIFACNPAGSQTPKGHDGWCTDDTDCKCKAQGAKCVGTYCTFTKASDAPAGGGGGGAAAGGGGGTPASAGTNSSAGTPTSSTAGTTAAGGTAAAPAEPPADEGGCSVGAPRGNTNGVALGLGLLGLGYALARRRR